MKLPHDLQQLYIALLSNDTKQVDQYGDRIEIRRGKDLHIFIIESNNIRYTLLNDIVNQAYSALGKEIK